MPAKMFPSMVVYAAKLAPVPALQKMWFGLAPPANKTLRFSVLVIKPGVRKIKTAFGWPSASRMRLPEVTGKQDKTERSEHASLLRDYAYSKILAS